MQMIGTAAMHQTASLLPVPACSGLVQRRCLLHPFFVHPFRAQQRLLNLTHSVPQLHSRGSCTRTQALHGDDWSTAPDCYLTLGLAHCFEKLDGGKLTDKFVIEPISANSLECMAADTFTEGLFCEDWEFRCGASARTWQRSHAQDNLLDIVPLGQNKNNFNYNLDEKRVLNFENVVDDSDNVKQDMSIDVYGRQTDEEKAEAKPDTKSDDKVAVPEEAEDEMDALLSV